MISDYFNSQRYKDPIESINRAFRSENKDFSELPLILQTNSYWLIGHSPEEIHEGIFDNPESMLSFQKNGIIEYLTNIDDDYIPYLMPWYGVSVVPNLFRCFIKFFKTDDPAYNTYGLKELKGIDKIKISDFFQIP